MVLAWTRCGTAWAYAARASGELPLLTCGGGGGGGGPTIVATIDTGAPAVGLVVVDTVSAAPLVGAAMRLPGARGCELLSEVAGCEGGGAGGGGRAPPCTAVGGGGTGSAVA